MTIALHLKGAYSPPVGRVDLHLGAGDDSRVMAVAACSAGARLSARVYHTHLGTVSARSAGARAIASVAYNPNLLSDTVSVAHSIWADGDAARQAMRFRFSGGPALQGAALPQWSAAPAEHGTASIPWQAAERASVASVAAWEDADGAGNATCAQWAQGAFAVGVTSHDWRDGDALSAHIRSGWIQLVLLAARLADHWHEGGQQSTARRLQFGDGRPLDLGFITCWRDAGYPAHRLRVSPPKPPTPWEPIGTNLCLVHPLPGAALHLGLGCPDASGATIIVPIQRVYHVINTVTLTRASDGLEVPVTGLSLNVDCESWAWTWSGVIPGSALSIIKVDGNPVELIATINGQRIHLLIDAINRSREFGRSALSISGRGRAAMLAAPTAPSVNRVNTIALTARQILIDALTDNGIPIGWGVDWQIEDWLIPAGGWVETGTYIYAAMRIARSGGGYVQSHDTDKTLIIKPQYPVLPWNWGSAIPDIVLPEDVCRTEGVEWIKMADYNAVWVTSGSAAGRRDYIRRAGTDGLLMAKTVVDSLATDAIMTRQVGAEILANTGKQVIINVKLPVISETGIIKPGLLVDYTEQGVTHRGITRAVRVDCGMPDVWQTVKIEARA